jgi:hypothetical protein
MSELKTNQIATNDGNNVAIDNSLNLKSYTTTQRDALTSAAGDMIYNSTTSKPQIYNGSAWEDFGPAGFDIEYLVIAGGGSGGQAQPNGTKGGGGGAGGYRSSVSGENTGGGGNAEAAFRAVTGTNYEVSVGSGATAFPASVASFLDYRDPSRTYSGGYSYFHNIAAIGGGTGGIWTNIDGFDGGSGGGSSTTANGLGTGGNPLRPTQGYKGGDMSGSLGSGGGGGAGAAGVDASNNTGGNGGAGLASSITGSSVTRAGGGGGGGASTAGTGGAGGGANGASSNSGGSAGTVNTGGGGGGSSWVNSSSGGANGGAGGSGVVILRWLTADATIGATRTGLTDGNVQTSGSYSYIVFTAGTGTISFS